MSTVVQGLLIAVPPDAFRGRVMGLYTMVAAGGVPIAALIGGGLGSALGPGDAVGIAAVVMLAFLAWLVATRHVRLIRFDLSQQNRDDPTLARARRDGGASAVGATRGSC